MRLSLDRALRWLAGGVVIGLVSGCAGLGTLSTEVSSFGEWPEGRKAGTYAFERLPSQQARAQAQDMIEDAARDALSAAGFQPAAAGADPEVLVQVGARATRYDVSPWSDPLWWRGGFSPWRYGPWVGPRWHPYPHPYWMDDRSYVDREVAILIRDRASGKPLYEARASSSGSSAFDTPMLRAMFAAALKDFPAVGLNPRVVTVPLGN